MHPSLHVGWNIVTTDKVIEALFASVFKNKTNCSWGFQAPELEESDGEQKETLINQKILWEYMQQ